MATFSDAFYQQDNKRCHKTQSITNYFLVMAVTSLYWNVTQLSCSFTGQALSRSKWIKVGDTAILIGQACCWFFIRHISYIIRGTTAGMFSNDGSFPLCPTVLTSLQMSRTSLSGIHPSSSVFSVLWQAKMSAVKKTFLVQSEETKSQCQERLKNKTSFKMILELIITLVQIYQFNRIENNSLKSLKTHDDFAVVSGFSAFPNIEIAYTLSSACKLSCRLAC